MRKSEEGREREKKRGLDEDSKRQTKIKRTRAKEGWREIA